MEEREFQGMEAAILEAEAEVERLEGMLSDPEELRRLGKALPEKVAELEKGRSKVESLFARWQELEALGPKR